MDIKMEQHENAINLIASMDIGDPSLNEATTRSRIIDTVLYDILSWPKNAVVAEEHINKQGYADYILKNQNDETVLIIEAKKEGVSFELPQNLIKDKNFSFVKIKTLLTDKSIESTIDQVRQYCFKTGTEYGAITNGHVWIFFKIFDSNWENLNGFVINNLKYFSEDFTEAYNLLSYNQVIKKRSLQQKLQQNLNKAKHSYSIKNNITSFSVQVDLNEYAQYISKPVKYYFGDFDEDDKDFLEHCYVDERLYENTKKTLTSLLVDSASPYLENSGVINYERQKLSRKLSKKITNFVDYSDNKHIVVIYGDRGCGKSTFIKKLIHSDIPSNVQDKLRIIYIDLLKYAAIEGEYTELKNRIWRSVLDKIDIDDLQTDYYAIQNILFKDEFTKYKEQIKSLYQEGSDIYGSKIEEKIKTFLKDYEKLAQRLAKYLRDEKKHEIVFILDNTDQYSSEIQDFCFQVLAEVHSTINCLSIITIREERFFRSKKLGVLDAYETTQYHISSPQADKVFLQRLNYLINSLEEDDFFNKLIENHDISNKPLVTKDNFKKYFSVFKKDFEKRGNLYNFLVSCAQKDMRMALDLFRELVVSGYMNIYEMISTDRNIFTLQIHQVLKPLMIPQKYFYDEKSSSIPNIFQLRHLEDGSHFTAIRILMYLNKNYGNYISLAVMKTEFLTKMNLEDDFMKNLSMLIKYKLIEANIKVDEYDPAIEEIIITPYGKYFIEKLIHFFTYLDLICTDCNIYDEKSANFISLSANKEYELFTNKKRLTRLKLRIEKTNEFIKYLIKEEKGEKEQYSLKDDFIVMNYISEYYQKDIKNVQNSASRQTYESDEMKILDDIFDEV